MVRVHYDVVMCYHIGTQLVMQGPYECVALPLGRAPSTLIRVEGFVCNNTRSLNTILLLLVHDYSCSILRGVYHDLEWWWLLAMLIRSDACH